MKKKSEAADPNLELKKKLWTHATKGEWKEVINIYDKYPEAQTLEVMRSHETVLHIAILDKKEADAEALVKKIDKIETLKMKNELGETALHLAAQVGSVRMCRSIAEKSTELVGERNKENETPLFVAAKHGRKEAFVCMYEMCVKKERRLVHNEYSSEDRATVLHAAIFGEHFDLAYQIIHLYPKHIINRSDNLGFLPLHLLARKPWVFKSGCQMGLLHRIVYFCIHVKKLEDESKSKKINKSKNLTGGVQEKVDEENPPHEGPRPGLVRKCYWRRFRCPTLISKAMDAILWTLGSIAIGNVIEEKKKYTWSVQIMDALLDRSKDYSYPEPKKDAKDAQRSNYNKPDTNDENIAIDNGKKEEAGTENENNNLPGSTATERSRAVKNIDDVKKNEISVERENILEESPLLMAAKNGILEMVKRILEEHPVAIHDVNLDNKNIVLVAVENRQPHIYQFLLDRKNWTKTTFYKKDKDGNSALHLAAILSNEKHRIIACPALHMQWEVKWYKLVGKSMSPSFFLLYNKKYETPRSIFRDNHKELVVKAGEWLNKTFDSCSIVSILIATVAFATYATVPGGLNSETGRPVLEGDPIFNLFAISSLIALCCSISSVVMFLVFFTSNHREIDFARNLPTKLLVELSSLLVAVAALLVAFCAAHSFVIRGSLKYTAFVLYAATLLPVAVYAFWQVPLYFAMAYETFHHMPQRIYRQKYKFES